LISEDHLVRVIDLYVAKLDLAQLGFDKALPKSTGRPSYDPADQLKLYLYGYFQRIRSSRRLEAECQRNIEVMWLINRLKPDFKTIADFRKNNKLAFVATCRAFVRFCRMAGLITGDLVATHHAGCKQPASIAQTFVPTSVILLVLWRRSKKHPFGCRYSVPVRRTHLLVPHHGKRLINALWFAIRAEKTQ